ncbi:unnamed protein product [Rhodiola kirilowii]
MALHRRRQQNHCSVRYIAATVSAAVIVLFLLLTLLSPYPKDDDENFQRHLRHKLDEAAAVDADKGGVFYIPSEGSRSDRDIWQSRNAELYHGCSDASNNFASQYFKSSSLSLFYPQFYILFVIFALDLCLSSKISSS